jgi:hypothetical protein
LSQKPHSPLAHPHSALVNPGLSFYKHHNTSSRIIHTINIIRIFFVHGTQLYEKIGFKDFFPLPVSPELDSGDDKSLAKRRRSGGKTWGLSVSHEHTIV